MSILDQLLGNSDQDSVNQDSNSSDTSVATDPGFGLDLSDVLHSSSTDDDGDSSSFTGIGDLGIGLSVPTFLGISSSSENSEASSTDHDNGGLLGGLL
jgi:hypothetical protein